VDPIAYHSRLLTTHDSVRRRPVERFAGPGCWRTDPEPWYSTPCYSVGASWRLLKPLPWIIAKPHAGRSAGMTRRNATLVANQSSINRVSQRRQTDWSRPATDLSTRNAASLKALSYCRQQCARKAGRFFGEIDGFHHQSHWNRQRCASKESVDDRRTHTGLIRFALRITLCAIRHCKVGASCADVVYDSTKVGKRC